jgi:hypothetical protein
MTPPTIISAASRNVRMAGIVTGVSGMIPITFHQLSGAEQPRSEA